MKNLAIFVLLILFSLAVFAQDPDPKEKNAKPDATPEEEKPRDEKEEFDKAIGQSDDNEKIAALLQFAKDFPESERRGRALENVVSVRAKLADQKLVLNETEDGIKLFKLAVSEAPTPVSERLFNVILSKFPANLYFRGQRVAAFEVASMIETKIKDNPKQLLALATFYVSSENGAGAKRLAERVIEIDENSAAAYYTLGFANRMNFDLEAAAAAFKRSLEINGEAVNATTSLAEMHRALGNPDEAEKLYRGLLEKYENDLRAKTGLVLSLFDAGKQKEAEGLMATTLEANPKNLQLLVGAAYWYAAARQGDKAVEWAKKAIEVEPRYTWSYIALARGYMVKGDPLAAERTLLAGSKFGSFPTLDYELACARMAAGFNREAAEALSKVFDLDGDSVKTKLGGRVERKADTFIDLLSYERRASIFQVRAADDPLDSLRLKNLFALMKTLDADDAEDAQIEEAADKFISGDDKMKTHRQIFVANQLLEKKKALPKVVDITKDAVSGVDQALDVRSPSAAVLADQLYESRVISLARGRTVLVPDIPRQTLSSIIRGRIEETAGWALFQQEKPEEAKIRLMRAISVLPKDSAWWRSSQWRLGRVLEAEGNNKEALDAYINGYFEKEQSTVKRVVIESLYTKMYGSLDGLEARLKLEKKDPEIKNVFLKQPPKEEQPKKNEEIKKDTEDEKLPEDVPLVDGEKKPDTDKTGTEEKINPSEEDKPKPNKTAEEKLTGLDNDPPDSPLVGDEKKTSKVSKIDGLDEDQNKDSEDSKKPVAKVNPDAAYIKLDLPSEEAVNAAAQAKKETTGDPEVKKKAGEDSKAEKEDDGGGLTRPRIVTEKTSCEISVSQETISIANSGGSLAILLSVEATDTKDPEFKAVSSSPEDVKVELDRGVGAIPGQVIFLIESISSNTGDYTVDFTTPCGKKKIKVTVR